MIDNLVFYIIILVVTASILAGGIRLYLQKMKITNALIQSEIDKIALLDHISKLSEKNQALEIQQTDGFLKFISESRDWAFNYIEEVQSAIVELHQAMETSDSGKIDEAYNRLVKFLPDPNPDVVK